MSEEFRDRLEAVNLEDNLKRVDFLLGNSKNVTSHGMGIKLALLMAQEMREGVPLGTKSGEVIAEWAKEFPDPIVEEAIASARAFLLNPNSLVETIGSKLFNEGSSNDQADDSDEDHPEDSDTRRTEIVD